MLVFYFGVLLELPSYNIRVLQKCCSHAADGCDRMLAVREQRWSLSATSKPCEKPEVGFVSVTKFTCRA